MIACWTTRLPAQDYPLEYPCYSLETAPHLDGKLDDAAWRAVPESSGFLVLSTDKRAVKATIFKAGWTGKALYIAVRCREESPAEMRAGQADGGAVYLDDSIEMLFNRPAVRSEIYRQLVMNSNGARCNLLNGTPVPNWPWEVKTVVGAAEWSLEARIPFASFGATAPQKNTWWLVNIARNITTGDPEEHYTCWPPLKAGFADIQNFGRFVFLRETPGPDSYRRFLADAVRKETGPLRKNRSFLLKGLAIPRSKPEAVRLLEIATRSEGLLTRSDVPIADLECFVEQNKRLGALAGELRSLVQMESLFE